MVQAVVFDMDGTLVDSLGRVPEAYVRAIAELGGPLVTTEDIVATWHIGPAPVVLAHFLGRLPGEDDLGVYFRHLEAAVAGIDPFPGIEGLLAALKARGLALGVYTTALRGAAEVTLAKAGLSRFFGVIVGGDDVRHPKPRGDGLIAACAALGIAPAASVYVGDSAADLGCAADAGARAIHALWAPRSKAVAGEHVRARVPIDVLQVIEAMAGS